MALRRTSTSWIATRLLAVRAHFYCCALLLQLQLDYCLSECTSITRVASRLLYYSQNNNSYRWRCVALLLLALRLDYRCLSVLLLLRTSTSCVASGCFDRNSLVCAYFHCYALLLELQFDYCLCRSNYLNHISTVWAALLSLDSRLDYYIILKIIIVTDGAASYFYYLNRNSTTAVRVAAVTA
jgi:hypothetical protein